MPNDPYWKLLVFSSLRAERGLEQDAYQDVADFAEAGALQTTDEC